MIKYGVKLYDIFGLLVDNNPKVLFLYEKDGKSNSSSRYNKQFVSELLCRLIPTGSQIKLKKRKDIERKESLEELSYKLKKSYEGDDIIILKNSSAILFREGYHLNNLIKNLNLNP